MRHLNYKHLYYFWVVARDGGIANASRSLFLTPQTISGQLAALEEQLGEKLFARRGRRLELTETGRLIYPYAEEMFRLGAELQDVLRGRLPGGRQTFTVGISDVVPKVLAFRLLEPALRARDRFHVVCQEGRFEDLLGRLAIHKIDLVIADSQVTTGLNVKVFNHGLGESGISFFATRGLAQRLRGRFPQCLDEAPILLPGIHTGLRHMLEQWFVRAEVQPAVVAEFDDSALAKAVGEAGIGVFAAPTVIEKEIVKQHDVQVIGRTDDIRVQYFAISAERRIRHPAVLAISESARRRLTS